MKKVIGFRTVKTGLGAWIAILIAECIGLKYAASAGIITILSIQSTKKESIQVAIRRFFATLLALLLGSLLFSMFGFNPGIFGVYLIVFIPMAVKLKVTEGIVPASVLVTHLLGEKMISMALITNEIAVMFIGAGVALLLNLYMPSVEKLILEDKAYIEDKMYMILVDMAKVLEKQQIDIRHGSWFKELEERLILAKKRAHQNSNNYLTIEVNHYEKYFEMRYRQFQTMKYMSRHFEKCYKTFEQTHKVAEFTQNVALSIYRKKTVEELFNELEELRTLFKQDVLPTSREEFENRATLYQFLNDIEQFLDIKKSFKEKLTEEERRIYNDYY